ncbi:MAG: DNA polymerase III subunit delta', partial [Defluviitaleaceae bacterium]|nr:DNA polymerase III subunit delta' [Defluviitaleaceae bacterium]
MGNEQVVAALRGAADCGRVPHALCVAGKPGSGRKMLSYAFAKALQCEAGRGAQTCGVCASCIALEAGTHPDVIRIRAEKNSIGVDVVRERIVAEMSYKPYRYAYKIFVVEDACALTPQAQNAMLKTLEEPCGYGVIILVADRVDNLLPTVRSRCVMFAMRSVGEDKAAEYLRLRLGIGAEDAAQLAQLSQGLIGRAVQLASDEEYRALRSHTQRLAEHAAVCSVVELFAFSKELEQYKHRLADVFEILIHYYREESAAQDVLDKARARLRHNGNF